MPNAKNEVEYIFCSVLSQKFLDFDCIRIFYTAENVIPDFNLYDYAIGYEKMEIGDRYFWDPLCYTCIRHDQKLLPDIFLRTIKEENRKFCAMVVSNGSNADTFRADFFYSLPKYRMVDSGGYLNNISGKVNDKVDFLKKYKFSFAMENVSHKGCCTEKIIESFAAGTIPIYWGDIGVTEYFNEKAFINCHAYLSIDDIISKVIDIDSNDEKYFSMLREPIFASDYYTPAEQDI